MIVFPGPIWWTTSRTFDQRFSELFIRGVQHLAKNCPSSSVRSPGSDFSPIKCTMLIYELVNAFFVLMKNATRALPWIDQNRAHLDESFAVGLEKLLQFLPEPAANRMVDRVHWMQEQVRKILADRTAPIARRPVGELRKATPAELRAFEEYISNGARFPQKGPAKLSLRWVLVDWCKKGGAEIPYEDAEALLRKCGFSESQGHWSR